MTPAVFYRYCQYYTGTQLQQYYQNPARADYDQQLYQNSIPRQPFLLCPWPDAGTRQELGNVRFANHGSVRPASRPLEGTWLTKKIWQ